MSQALSKASTMPLQLDTPRKALHRRRLLARYDSAETNENNRRHWAHADGLSADAAAGPDVRRTLRNRARYEVANNSYARGIVMTLANDTIGTGPRLQLLSDDPALNDEVETAFEEWAQAVDLAHKLRTLRMARAQDGEAFAVLASNPGVPHEVTLDFQPLEADRIASPWRFTPDDNEIDGVILDRFGNPIAYRVLKYHPGSARFSFSDDHVLVPARAMIHVFRQDRPGQHRGIPEITPALPLFAQLRRFTLAVLSAAEAAADFAGILYTDAPANGEADAIEPLDLIELERNMLMTMPGGWKMSQVDPKQPATTYAEFKKEILNEIARCLNMPFNIAAGNSSGYNYASGRLDHQTYFKSIRVDQDFMAARILDPIFLTWVREYALISRNAELLRNIPLRQWFWDGFEHVDPAKEANAQETRLKNFTTTLAHEYAKAGRDWEVELKQRAKEKNLMRELGLSEVEVMPVTSPKADQKDVEEESDE